MQLHVGRRTAEEKAAASDYFAAASAPTVVRSAMFFEGGQVSISEFSARPNPSLESVAVRARRLAPAACDVSVKLNCPSDISDRISSLLRRSPQNSKPCNFFGGDVKYRAAEAAFETASVGNSAPVKAGRWKSSSNWSALKQTIRHCVVAPGFFGIVALDHRLARHVAASCSRTSMPSRRIPGGRCRSGRSRRGSAHACFRT